MQMEVLLGQSNKLVLCKKEAEGIKMNCMVAEDPTNGEKNKSGDKGDDGGEDFLFYFFNQGRAFIIKLKWYPDYHRVRTGLADRATTRQAIPKSNFESKLEGGQRNG